jgi:hypothetical protein
MFNANSDQLPTRGRPWPDLHDDKFAHDGIVDANRFGGKLREQTHALRVEMMAIPIGVLRRLINMGE